MSVRDIHYAWPGAAYFLFGALALLLCLWLLYEYRRSIVNRYGAERFRSVVVRGRSPLHNALYPTLLAAAWIFAVLALMQPQGKGRYQKTGDEEEVVEEVLAEEEEDESDTQLVRRKAHELIFLLDTSASMDVADTQQGVTRLQYAKEIIDEVVASVDGDAVALYAFTSEVTPLVPPTNDTLFFRLLLRQVGVNEGDVAGTDLAKALEEVASRHFRPAKNRRTTVVVLTDGGDTRLEQLSGAAREQEMKAIDSRLATLEDKPIRLFTIGLGSPKGAVIPGLLYDGKPVESSLDEELLQLLARHGKGRYYFANGTTALGISQSLHAMLREDDPFVEEIEVEVRRGRVERTLLSPQEIAYEQYFQIPLALAILSLAAALLLPEYRRRALCLLLCLSGSLYGQEETLQQQWRQAATLYDAEQYVEALAEYDAILQQELTPLERLTGELNRAQVLAASGDYEAALQQMRASVPDEEVPDAIVKAYRRRLINLLLLKAEATPTALVELAELQEALAHVEEALQLLRQPDRTEEDPLPSKLLEVSFKETRTLTAFAKGLRHDLRVRMLQILRRQAGLAGHAQELLQQVQSTIERVEPLLTMDSDATRDFFPVLAQLLAREQPRLEEFREAFYKKLESEEVVGREALEKLFVDAESSYLSATEALREGLGKRARLSLGEARLGFGFLGQQLGEGEAYDPIVWLLQQRALLLTQKEQATDPLAEMLAGESLQAQLWLERILQAVTEEESLEEFQRALLTYLLDRLQKAQTRGEDARWDLLYYLSIQQSEESILVTLHERTLALPPKGFLDSEVWAEFLLALDILDQRLGLRGEHEEGSRARAAAARGVLGEALQWRDPPEATTLQDLLERILLVWEPRAYTLARLKNLQKEYEALLASPSLTEVEIRSVGDGRKKLIDVVQRFDTDEEGEPWEELVSDLYAAGNSEAHATSVVTLSRPLTSFFLLDALRWSGIARQRLEENSVEPAEVLRRAIDKEQGVLLGTQLLEQVKVSDRQQAAVDGTLLVQQGDVIAEVGAFSLPEEEEIAERNTIDELVKKGEEAALKAFNTIEGGDYPLYAVADPAREAVDAWEEALRLLSEPQEQQQEPSSDTHEGESEQEEESQKQQQQQEQEQSSSSEEQERQQQKHEAILQGIQQMEQEDAPLLQEPEREPKRGLRPW